ncbi:MAG: TlpA disulfide reductase family protein [Bacteroidales bacterium]
MKRIFIALFALALVQISVAQNKIPSVKIKDVAGKEVNTADLSNDGKPMILSFWATWCKPCLKELKAIGDVYTDWVDETGVKLVAISVDDARSSAKVKTMADANGWEYEMLLDLNGDFKRAMNVANPPHIFIIDGKGNIVYQHNGYSEGSENELIEKVRLLNEGKDISKH